MLQLKGTWSRMETVEETVNGVPQKPRQFKMIWSIDRDLITANDEDGFAATTYRYTLNPQQGAEDSRPDPAQQRHPRCMLNLQTRRGFFDGLPVPATAQGLRAPPDRVNSESWAIPSG